MIVPRTNGTSRHLRRLANGLIVLAVFGSLAGQTQAGQHPTDSAGLAQAPFGLQLTSPGPTGVSTHNQLTGIQPATVAIDDAAMSVPASQLPVKGLAKGLKTVAVVVGGKWYVTPVEPDDRFATTIDLTGTETGPLVLDVFGWDTVPNDHNYKVSINLRTYLFVENTSEKPSAQPLPPSHPAQGRKLVWSESFDELTKSTWHLGQKPDGQDFGAAVFAKTDVGGSYRTMHGFLRLRAQYRPELEDATGWKRKWVSGQISTGFPDGSVRAAFRKGYFEARMLLPAGAGTWSSFWLLDQHGIRASKTEGAVEIDVIEGYGHAMNSYAATEHDWPPPSAKGAGYQKAMKNVTGLPDLSLGFHDYGVEITDDEVIYYFDGAPQFRAPLYRKTTISPFFLILTLAMSHDWPIAVPPSGYYDLWVDRVQVYQ